MGKQINFFLVGQDEADFLDFVYKQGDVIIDNFGKIMNKKEVILANLWKVFIKSPNSRLVTNHLGRIQDFESNVIEFDKTQIKEKRIASGRIYVELYGFDINGNKFKKDKWVEDKFNLYKKWIIKHSKTSKDKKWYIGNNTYELYIKGYITTDDFNVKHPELEQKIEF